MLTKIVPALHRLFLEMLLIFLVKQLIMDKAEVYQETSAELLL